MNEINNQDLHDCEGRKLYSLSEVEEELKEYGTKKRRLRYLIETDQLKAKKLGWVWVVTEEELEKLKKLEEKYQQEEEKEEV